MEPGRLGELVGYRAIGRYGDLGVVVGTRSDGDAEPPVIVVRGGVTRGLLFEVPVTRLVRVLHAQRKLIVDADVADFIPRLTRGGEVELRLDP